MKNICIVDYGMGNIDSVVRAVEEGGGIPQVTSREQDFAVCQGIILPGVGAFRAGMQNLRAQHLDNILGEQVLNQHVPFLGICLGMQLTASQGWEGGQTKGLNWLNAEVKRIEANLPLKIPHVGWNEVNQRRSSLLWEGIPSGKDFYFVHSFHMICEDQEDVLATTHYGVDLVCAVQKGNIWGVQFHPEKSLQAGLKLIENFIRMC